jgi:uncharacterized membrane protein
MTHGKTFMSIDLKEALEFLRDAIDKIILVTGFFLLILAVALFSRTYQWYSSISLLCGVLLIVVGISLHYESFTLKIPSAEGWGTILMGISALFMAAAVIVFLFAVPGRAYVLPTSFRPRAENIIFITLTRPNAWIAPIFAGIGIGLFIFGVVLKFFRDIF